jgi:hypothetical protein
MRMTKTVNLVYSQPPEGTADEADFNRWYDEHRFEVLSIDGFASVQRFRLLPVVSNPDAPFPYRYLAFAELDRDADEVMAEMERRGMNSRDSYVELKKDDSSGPTLPTWWDDVRFASWNGVALGERVESTTPSSDTGTADLYIVFSQPPDGPGEDDEFNAWYDEHLHEILEIPGFVAAQRFRLTPAVENPQAPSPYRYVALFEVNREPDAINDAMVRCGLNSRDSYVELKKDGASGPALPTWWDRVRFASWNAASLGERVHAGAEAGRS